VTSPQHHFLGSTDFRAVARFTLTCLTAACARAKPAQQAPPAISAVGTTTTILRDTSFKDADLAKRGRARLQVVVRATDPPLHVLQEAQVLIRTTRDTVVRATDQRGLTRFDSLPVGEYELLVRRIGYDVARAVIPIKPGCQTDIEADISVQMLGINPPTPKPGRVTVTTCR